MLGVEVDRGKGYLELTVDGRIGEADFEKAVEAIDSLLETHKHIDIVEVVLDIGWVEPEVWWQEIVFNVKHRNFLRRVAVVSDSGWLGPLTRLFAPLYPAAIRTFSCGEIEAAREWATEHDPYPGDVILERMNFA